MFFVTSTSARPAEPTTGSARDWWRTAVTYQIYIRSFADGDGDGLGDIAGIRSRLPYLVALGVDALWINPWYPSPQKDGGYDVADYRDIDPAFGTLSQARALIDEAHEHGLRVVLDVVPNHTSDQHAWFQAALAAPPGSAERARYIFRTGRGPGGDLPPNDWRSIFGGPAWQRVLDPDTGRPGQWYLHLFTPEQPDLNWDNPEVRAEFLGILRFWFDAGADGFRIDVAHGLVKEPSLPDLGIESDLVLGHHDLEDHPHWDLPGVHAVYREWRAVADSYEPPKMFVGEAWVTSPQRLAAYLRPDELHSAFDFSFVRAAWDAAALRSAVTTSLAAHESVAAPVTWTLSNHDITRHLTRFGRPQDQRSPDPLHGDLNGRTDVALGTRRARAAALLLLALPGAAYLYQGEELGLPEVEDLPEDVLQDPVWERSGRTQRGRDGCRVPLPWTSDGPSFGFGAGPAWLPQPPSWAGLAAQVQDGDASSMLTLYRRALAARRELPDLRTASLEWVDDDAPGVLAFRRGERLVCVVNTASQAVPVPATGRVVLASADLTGGQLPPDAAAWILTD